MTILRIEHAIQNFQGWKKAFDSDPIDRKKAGVKHYRIYTPVDDPNYIIIDLEFENRNDAEDCLAALRKLWEKVEGTVMFDPQTRVLEIVETIAL
ncbi:MAG: hypothetical protein ABIT58_07615 [Ferruginibacter sp.]